MWAGIQSEIRFRHRFKAMRVRSVASGLTTHHGSERIGLKYPVIALRSQRIVGKTEHEETPRQIRRFAAARGWHRRGKLAFGRGTCLFTNNVVVCSGLRDREMFHFKALIRMNLWVYFGSGKLSELGDTGRFFDLLCTFETILIFHCQL